MLGSIEKNNQNLILDFVQQILRYFTSRSEQFEEEKNKSGHKGLKKSGFENSELAATLSYELNHLLNWSRYSSASPY